MCCNPIPVWLRVTKRQIENKIHDAGSGCIVPCDLVGGDAVGMFAWRRINYRRAQNCKLAPLSTWDGGTNRRRRRTRPIRPTTISTGKEANFTKEAHQTQRILYHLYAFQLLEYQWSEGEFDTLEKLGSAHRAQGTPPSEGGVPCARWAEPNYPLVKKTN